MGTFRLMLATAVMLGHFYQCYPHPLPYLISGAVAVPAFYIVSGFLITLVLTEKYRGSPFLFLSNRLLRIFPIYWAAIVLYLVVNLLAVNRLVPGQAMAGLADFRDMSVLWYVDQPTNQVGLFSAFILALSNLLVFGQDLFIYLGRWPHPGTFDGFYHGFFVVRQAWTLALELGFYLIAPLVVTRTRAVVAVLALSLLARAVVAATVWRGALTDYAVLPFELTFFMAGSLAYRGYAFLRLCRPSWSSAYVAASCTTIVVLTLFYLRLPPVSGRWAYLLAVALCLPGIVTAGEKFKYDRVLGDFSYPIYLIHMALMIAFVPGTTRGAELGAIAGVIGVCALLLYVVEWPLDRLRQQRALAKAALAVPVAMRAG